MGGTLRVSAPFCGSVQELPVLAAFLNDRLLTRTEVNSVFLLGSDLLNWDIKGGYWRQKERYCARKYPNVQVQFRQLDLGREQHPQSALTIAVHPECTINSAESPWPTILT